MQAGTRLKIAVVTGSRAEYGLLKPVMRAVQARPELELLVIAAGSHLVLPSLTFRDVKNDFEVADSVPMQIAGKTGRLEDVESVARGIGRFARSLERLKPDWVVVLGDRIEVFAAASAASIGGFALAHIHGGDRAEGIADEAMRHAITKLAHLHFPATPTSAERVIRMGEDPARVHCVGSPAIDGLSEVRPMTDEEAAEVGDPLTVFLYHPSGLPAERERHMVEQALETIDLHGKGNVLCLAPNFDPGRDVILDVLTRRCNMPSAHRRWRLMDHLPRDRFVALLKRLVERDVGMLVGNSSAGLIEAPALGVRVFNFSPRQSGRERPDLVVSLVDENFENLRTTFEQAFAIRRERCAPPPYGDGHAGERVADLLSRTNPREPGFLRKRCAY